jgi:hypothetical protein
MSVVPRHINFGGQDSIEPRFSPRVALVAGSRRESNNQDRFAMAFISTTHYSQDLPERTYFSAVVYGARVAGTVGSPQVVVVVFVFWRTAINQPEFRVQGNERQDARSVRGHWLA